jgi:hypothetical protein
VCLARIWSASQWHSEGRKIACTGRFGQIRSSAHGDVNGLIASVTNNSAAKFFVFLGHARFSFLVKKIFVRDEKLNSFFSFFFLSILESISSLKPAGEAEKDRM